MIVDKSSTLFHTDIIIKEYEGYEFSAEKNQLLITERGIGFKEVVTAINGNKVIAVIDHHNQTNYSHQRIYVVNICDYIYMVPFVKKTNDIVFFKTIIPNRKLTKKYLSKKGNTI